MPEVDLKLKTDSAGAFDERKTYNPPVIFPVTVKISVKLESPPGVKAKVSLDIDAEDGDPTNTEKTFEISTGETVDLGKWMLDGGDNLIVLKGTTNPPKRNAELGVKVIAALA